MIASYKTLESVSKEKFIGSYSGSVTELYLNILIKMMTVRSLVDKLLLVQAGFAVDLAVGYVTREHDDLDLTTFVSDIPVFKELFSKANFKIGIHPNTDPNLSFYAQTYIQDIQKSIYVDVVSLDISGEEVFDVEVVGGEKYIFPIKASELIWERKIDDTPMQFFSPYLVYKFKKIQQKRDVVREKDREDFSVLEKFYPELKSNTVFS